MRSGKKITTAGQSKTNRSVLSSGDFPDHSEAIAAAAEKIRVGAGELRIVDSRVTPGKNGSETGDIDWLRFE